ncbi:hypothetical protein Q4489_02395 [Thalassotalea sp. 1_MG-2023]|uniref:hypothetical protein n=1 Tax=Thalassotalea sp. 1_MG-2023 TaxID=3062680 RepID=UPI0026E49454|nr:hypothetical protein [Thalassotalea sp. 1_MG-2023]MDO6425840.1 hypothetical protein [Thalassotalea sp. 1_MG-2023]
MASIHIFAIDIDPIKNKEDDVNLAAHGDYNIERENNILVVDARGPFNEITAKAYVKDMQVACEQYQGKPWGLLITFYGNSIFTPEAEKILVDVTRYRMQHGMIANASVIVDSNTADIQQMQLKRVYQSCNLTFHVFTDIFNAKQWLVEFVKEQSQAM